MKVIFDPRMPPDAPIFFYNEENMKKAIASGQELAEQGMERAGSGFPVSSLVSWQGRAKLAVLNLCAADANFSSDDVRKAAGDPPHPNAIGGVLRWAYKAGIIEPAGITTASRPSRHASILRMWRRA